MTKQGNVTFTQPHIGSLSMLESNAAVLYRALADRIALPSVKSLLLDAGAESEANSSALKELAHELKQNEPNHLDESFTLTYAIFKQIIAAEEVTPEELLAATAKLDILERTLSQKFASAHRECQAFNRELREKSHDVFSKIIGDCNEHCRQLGTIQALVDYSLTGEWDSRLITAEPAAPFEANKPAAQFKL